MPSHLFIAVALLGPPPEMTDVPIATLSPAPWTAADLRA